MTRSRMLALVTVDVALLIVLLVGLLGPRSVPADRPLTRAALGSAESVIIDADEAIVLVRSESGWKLALDDERYPARQDRIEPFIEEIESGRVIREVTDDSDLHADFGVSEALSRRVTIDAVSGAVELLFGSTGDQAGTIYVREPGDTTVILARSAVDFYLRQPASFWAYLRVFPEDVVAADVVRIRLRLERAALPAGVDPGYTDLELVRDADRRWYLATESGTTTASEVEVARYARDLADLVGDGFYEGLPENLAPVGRLWFSVSDGREFSADILTDGAVLVVNPDGRNLPGSLYGGLRYTLALQKLLRLIPRTAALAE
ncbi:MAG: DUF4340 domain-containing protein [Spirochaetota bacterium]